MKKNKRKEFFDYLLSRQEIISEYLKGKFSKQQLEEKGVNLAMPLRRDVELTLGPFGKTTITYQLTYEEVIEKYGDALSVEELEVIRGFLDEEE